MMQQEDIIWTVLPVAAMILDGRNRIVTVNPAAEGFLMQSARSVVGHTVQDVLAVDAPIEDALNRARQNSAPLYVNDVTVVVDGRGPAQCNLQIAPVKRTADDEMLLLISPLDMSGWFSQQQSIKSPAKSAIGMAEMLAHEIKNPLAGITGAAQLLSMDLSREDQELTDLIVSESRRIVALLDQVEQFGNVSAPHLQAVNIHDVLDRARRSAMLGFAEGMKIEEAYDPSLPLALVDANQILQVIQNLLKNASEAGRKTGSKIILRSYYEQSLRLRQGAGRALPLQIEVIDDGPGLPEEIADNVFDPFVSGRENGTGLGLALAAKIISEHDGLITVKSAPGHTVFRISLPLAPKTMKEHA